MEPGSPAAPEQTPQVAGVRLAARIGAGGSGEVWAGRLGEVEVAVKIALGTGEAFAHRFAREADALERVGAPHVPRLHDHGRLDDGRAYLVMERLVGQTLARVIEDRQGALMPLARVHAIADAILASLAAVHGAGLIHRDLKPENLFLRDDGSAAILDFGLTRLSERDGWTSTGVVMGSSLYLSPEQLRGDAELDARADLYAFGAILYRLLTLRPPFAGGAASVEHGHLALRPVRPRLLRPLPAALEDLTLACLAKQPARRPPDASTVRARLAAACAEPPAALEVERPAGPAEEAQPVILAWIETAGSGAAVSAAVERRGGWLARQRGGHYLAAFASGSAEDPLRAAHAAAVQVVAEEGGRAALHLASVTLVARAGHAPRLSGDAIDRPEAWLPAGDWSGVEVGAELAGRTLSDAHDGPLFGRDEIAAALEASARRCLTDGAPGLCTLVAGRGQGKSRLLWEAGERFRRLSDAARVMRVDCSGASDAAGDLLRQLGRSGPLGDALRAEAERGPLAVLVDDAHRADEALLDALEYATAGSGGPLWVVVAALAAASPAAAELRPRWGLRAERHDAIAVPALGSAAARQLAAHLLLPAEYPPAEILARLADWTGDNPLHLTEVVRALERAGLVRPRAGAHGHHLATELLDALPDSPLIEWLGVRELAELPAAVAACAQLVAVLGPEVGRDELEEVQDLAERSGELTCAIDAGVGLDELTRAGLLRRDGERHRFRSDLVRESIYRRLPEGQRARLHRHALAAWRARSGESALRPTVDEPVGRGAAPGPDPAALVQVARHAAACGERSEAADAVLQLADASRGAHRLLDADRYYTRALALLDEGDPRRIRALGGRGRARYRIDRVPESLDDLAAARALAGGLGDSPAQADLLLEEATALDWMESVAASRARAEEARPLVDACGDARLAVRLRVAVGRSLWRAGRAAEAGDLLEEAAAAAAANGDDESRVIALLLLAPIRVSEGRSEAAAAALDEVLDRCARTGDRLHRQAALFNRCFLALARHSIDGAIADLRRVIDLAREDGHPTNERKACFNLAELRFWSGDDDESLALARRTRLLEERFEGRLAPRTPLLIARIHAVRGELTDMQRELDWLRDRAASGDWSDGDRLLARALQLHGRSAAPAAPVGDWEALVDDARARLPPEELLEVLYWTARSCPARRQRALDEAAPLLAQWPISRPRFQSLEQP